LTSFLRRVAGRKGAIASSPPACFGVGWWAIFADCGTPIAAPAASTTMPEWDRAVAALIGGFALIKPQLGRWSDLTFLWEREVAMGSASRTLCGRILVTTAFTMALVCAGSTLLPAQGLFRTPQISMPIEEQPGYEPDPSAEQLPPAFQRQLVFYRTTEPPGTIIVQTSERFLYLVQGNNRAIRYGIGVGRDGFQWAGLLKISRKAEWPDWRPPPEMIERQPYLPRFMAGGPGNPLGARALYLGETVYRIHGTNQPQTIGQTVSSGCFRLVNPDVIDLFDRVPVGTKVVVRQTPEM
jgi:lipoprotein-anchoring transpeptidase ErfK/SrfK